MPSIEDIIEKIKKLNAKATDKATTEAEAALFMQKVQEMLAEHNLDMTTIDVEEDKAPIDEEDIETPYAHIKWRSTLLTMVAKLYFCEAYRKTADKKFVIAGKSHNRIVAVSMYNYLCATVVRLSRDFSSDTNKRYHFEKGCGYRLTQRVFDEFEKVREPVQTNNPHNLPALYKTELALVADFLADKGLVDARRKKTSYNQDAYAGYKAANSVSLNNQVSGSKDNKFLLGGKK